MNTCDQCGEEFRASHKLQRICPNCRPPMGEHADDYPEHTPETLEVCAVLRKGRPPTPEQQEAFEKWIRTEWPKYRQCHVVANDPR